jgi:hypothetical protein
MKRLLTTAAGLVLVMGLAAALAPAQANCLAARGVISTTPNNQTYLYTPGNPFTPNYAMYIRPGGGTVSYYINGEFWAFGAGNPTVGIGVDSGNFKGQFDTVNGQLANWLIPGYFGGQKSFFGGPAGHWQTPGSDGCITTTGSSATLPDDQECNIVLLQDEDGAGTMTGFFAVLATDQNTAADFEYTTATGFPPAIMLAPIPKPQITGSARVPPDDVNLTVVVNATINPANGFYLNCSPSQNGAIADGYRLYGRRVPRLTPKPTQHNTRWLNQALHLRPGPPLPPWQSLTPAKVPLNQPTNILANCNGNEDLWIGASLTFGGVAGGAANYETKIVSMNSTKIECGPNLAEPKPLERPARQAKPSIGDRPAPRR